MSAFVAWQGAPVMLHTQLRIALVFYQLHISASGPNVIHPNDFWLPGEVLPLHYNLSLQVNMEDFTTEGEVSILLDVVRPTKQITLHVHPDFLEVTHNEVKVKDMGGKEWSVEGHAVDAEKQFYTVKLSEGRKPGSKLVLVLPFKGLVREWRNMTGDDSQEDDNYRGLFKSRDDAGGAMAVTQFQSMYARAAFPCFDEPRLKATFVLKLGRGKEYRTRSNTAAKEEGAELVGKPGYLWDTYTVTPIMSTYLLAWTVFNSKAIKSSSSTSSRGVEIQAFYKRFRYMEHAAVVCAKQLDYFEQHIFVGINYTLPKLDIVTVPEFAAAAMENWGMFTFQTNAVIYAEAARDKYTVSNDNTMAHELVICSKHI